MHSKKRVDFAWSCAALLILVGCQSGGGASALSPLGLTAASAPDSTGAASANLAGQYRGKFSVKTAVIGNVTFDLTQSGSSIGGTLKLVVPKQRFTEPVAMALKAANDTFSGNAIDAASKTPCTYALNGSFNPKTLVLKGTSTPLTCAGQRANFTATERCYYNTGSKTNAVRRNDDAMPEC
jgi:hypothetical protein